MRAERIWLDTDEDGFHLVIEDEEGKQHNFVIPETSELLHVARQIQDWETDGGRVRRRTRIHE